jgi:hypothetical protein
MNQSPELTSDAPPATGAEGSSHVHVIHTAAAKIVISALVIIIGLIVSALIYSDQADLYDSAFPVSIVRQLTYETAFQPIYLVVVVVPIMFAAARNVSWLALGAGGLILMSILLPYARFEYFDVTTGDIERAHNSLYQLAGPGHRMPEFVSVLFLMLMAGGTALFWRVRIGGLIAILGAITMAFVWPTVFNEPPVIDDEALILFPGKALLFGYYIAWFGALIAVIGEASLLTRLTGRKNSDAAAEDSAVD